MFGFIEGKVVFSDGQESIIKTESGIGYQVYFSQILPEEKQASLYLSHIVRESLEDLYAFNNLLEKKLFELLITVKGVGPKLAYSLIAKLGAEAIIDAVRIENKKVLSSVSGVGPKAASQIMLDLAKKILKVKMYSAVPLNEWSAVQGNASFGVQNVSAISASDKSAEKNILDEALWACKELGFKEEIVLSLARKILSEHEINRPEQLVHLVLKEI